MWSFLVTNGCTIHSQHLRANFILKLGHFNLIPDFIRNSPHFPILFVRQRTLNLLYFISSRFVRFNRVNFWVSLNRSNIGSRFLFRTEKPNKTDHDKWSNNNRYDTRYRNSSDDSIRQLVSTIQLANRGIIKLSFCAWWFNIQRWISSTTVRMASCEFNIYWARLSIKIKLLIECAIGSWTDLCFIETCAGNSPAKIIAGDRFASCAFMCYLLRCSTAEKRNYYYDWDC